eukprot:Ihof_evm1s451 gene=Ihof_evmTU1s451
MTTDSPDAAVDSSGERGPTPALTNTMVKEEEALEVVTQREEEQQHKKEQAELGSMTAKQKMAHQKSLNHLINQAEIYANFIDQQMRNRQIKETKELERAQRKKEKAASVAAQANPETQNANVHDTRGDNNTKSEPAKATRTKRKSRSSKQHAEHGITETVQEDSASQSDTQSLNDNLEDNSPRYYKDQLLSDRQPKLVTGCVMREYQLDGMEWIASLYENGLNGILGDEMGLGKTLQCISFIAYLTARKVPGPFLVVAPLSTLQNWVNEFKRFTPSLRVLLYHGSPTERTALRNKHGLNGATGSKPDMKKFPIVVTSFEICMRDRKALQYLSWKYIFVDEGHRIKNLNCRLIRELKQYRSVNRLLLTGTPLQNNLSELWSLLNFLMPEIFDSLNNFQKWFDFDNDIGDNEGDKRFLEKETQDHLLRKLHGILKPFLLRRLKTDVEYRLPHKKEIALYTKLTPTQERLYKASLERDFAFIMDGDSTGSSTINTPIQSPPSKRRRRSVNYKEVEEKDDFYTIDGEPSEPETINGPSSLSTPPPTAPRHLSQYNVNVKNILMLLRKVCNHPYLLEYPLTDSLQYRVDEDIINSCGKLLLLDRMLPALKAQGHRVLIFSQMVSMLDILHDYLHYKGYGFCRFDGSTAQVDRQEQIDEFNNNSENFVFLLSTRSGGLGINLVSADTVIIYDSDWNPQVDLQAMDRCHRIGQTKPVIVYRLITQHTVEDRMMKIAQAKRKLEKLVVHKGSFKGKDQKGVSLSMQDIKQLLDEKEQME